jgi:hypothetical protein
MAVRPCREAAAAKSCHWAVVMAASSARRSARVGTVGADAEAEALMVRVYSQKLEDMKH